MSDIQSKQLVSVREPQLDLIELIFKVWSGRKFIFLSCAIALIIGLIIAFSIPKEYTTSVTMAPESAAKSSSGGLGTLASMAGISLGSNSGGEALSPELYPDIVKTTPFLLDLFQVQVTNKKKNLTVTLYDYMNKHQVSPWWNSVASSPFKALGWLSSMFTERKEPTSKTIVDPFQLTSNQAAIMHSISNRIMVSVNKKSGVITLSVTMQDPSISAALTDTVMRNLQTYIVDYRTNKAKHDLAYTEKLYKEAKADYYNAQQRYADFSDSNRDIILIGYRTRLERLQNEATLAYSLYSQISQQLQLAKAKVQEVTPVYTVIQPAGVPLTPIQPNKPLILIAFLFMGFVISIGWILFGKELFARFKPDKLD